MLGLVPSIHPAARAGGPMDPRTKPEGDDGRAIEGADPAAPSVNQGLYFVQACQVAWLASIHSLTTSSTLMPSRSTLPTSALMVALSME